MKNKKLTSLFKIALCGILLSCNVEAKINDLCKINYDEFSPLAQRTLDKETKVQEETILPKDVLTLTKELAKHMQMNGVRITSLKPVLKIKSALPRTNLILAYDIFLLSQLYNQQKLGLVSIPPQLKYPAEIVPAHVYQWVDASLALWQCHHNKIDTSDIETSALILEITPIEVFYLMANLQANLMREIDTQLLQEFFVLRVLSIEFLLQDLLIEKNLRLTNKRLNNPDQQFDVLDELLLSSLKIISELNGQIYLDLKQALSSREDISNDAFRFVTSALLFGETLFFNNQNQALEPMPMLPILNHPMSEDSIKLQLNEIFQILDAFNQNIDVKDATKN